MYNETVYMHNETVDDATSERTFTRSLYLKPHFFYSKNAFKKWKID